LQEKKCEICGKRRAVTRVRKVIGGVVKEAWVCEKCILKAGINDQLPQDQETKGTYTIKKSSLEKVCPNCLLTLTELKRTGLLGCQKCYEVFEDEIEELALRFHGVSSHLLKSIVDVNFPKPDILELKKRLEIAIKLERYEEAAKLRDEIRRLEKN